MNNNTWPTGPWGNYWPFKNWAYKCNWPPGHMDKIKGVGTTRIYSNAGPTAWTAQVILARAGYGSCTGAVLPARTAKPPPALPSRPLTPRAPPSPSDKTWQTLRPLAATKPGCSTSSASASSSPCREPTSTWHCGSTIPRTRETIPISGFVGPGDFDCPPAADPESPLAGRIGTVFDT